MAERRNRTAVGYRPALTRFARILFTLGSGESAWLIVAFVLGVLALGVLSNLLYDAVASRGGVDGGDALRALLAAGALIVLAYAAYRYDLFRAWRAFGFRPTIDEQRRAPPHAGLIWLLSPGSIELPLFAINYHYVGGDGAVLRHGWVLITRGAQSAFTALNERVSELGLKVDLHPVYLNAETIEATHHEVDAIFRTQAGLVGLSPEQIIADLTGGLKPMTAGMVLACLPHGRALEYIESDRNPASGQPIPGTLRAVLVGIDFGGAL